VNRSDFIDWCAADHLILSQKPGYSPLIMGILNVTPDSFYDGGQYSHLDAAYDHAQAMIAAGADILDIGGESSRPGAVTVSVEEELDRVMPLVERIRAADPIALSIDTYKPQVMQAAIAAGAACINDIYALQMPGAIEAVANTDTAICLMHMQGMPQTMQDAPQYAQDVVTDIDAFFEQRISACVAAGIERSRLIIDPGFGFGKTVQHNLQMVQRIAQFQHHALPILLGVSRKSTIGKILDQPPEGRMAGGLALAIYAMLVGVSIIRTHDVLETKQSFKILQEMRLSVGVGS
jgi:dihydropteroate synthase